MRNKRIFLIVFCLLALLLALWLVFSLGFPGNASNAKKVIYQIENTRQHSYFIYEKNLLLVNNEGATLIDKNGIVKWQVELLVKSPIVSIAGRYIMIADRDGLTAALISHGKIIKQLTTDQPIISQSLNKRGYFTLVTTEEGYKNKLMAYSPRGEQYYIWKVRENYILDSSISKNGKKIAGSLLSTKENHLSGVISIIDTDKDETIKEIAYPDDIYPEIQFLTNDSLIAIGDADILSLDSNYNEKSRISFNGRPLEAYSFSENGAISLSFSNNRNTSTLEFYDPSAKRIGNVDLDYELNILDLAGGVSLACGARQIGVFNFKGRQKAHTDLERNFKWVGLVPNSGALFLVSGNNIEYIHTSSLP